jgi:biopolymer transport protein ExbB
MHPSHPIAYFFAHTDTLGAVLFCLLLLMSLLSWFGILSKAIGLWQTYRAGRSSRRRFWQDPASAVDHAADPFARLAHAAFAVHRDLQAEATPGSEELLLRCMNRIVGEEAEHLASGQTLLATVAAVAPFIGLFGTVWGVHHALLSIGSAGSAAIEQIAGPVGEALIMTALGLAVAIPALLGYNLFARNSQRLLADLDSFAHDLHHYLVTGRPLPATMQTGMGH